MAINRDRFEDILRSAAGRAWNYIGPKARNESDFKHELYHQLALESLDDTRLHHLLPGTTTCRLHAETKVAHGRNSSKADLSICDPTSRLPFNYDVHYVMELKHRFKKGDVRQELKKFGGYANRARPLFLFSAEPCDVDAAYVQQLANESGASVVFIAPRVSSYSPIVAAPASGAIDWKSVEATVVETIGEVLRLYGSGRRQYHGFFWCNYEQEVNKKQTYPCEGDFLCQLYTRLRVALPAGLTLLTEYTPTSSRYRIDCVITDGRRALPIEAKMNWDQFESKTVDGERREREASTIVERLELLGREIELVSPKIIVIQMDLRQTSNRKETAFGIFDRSSVPFDLLGFSEHHERVISHAFRRR